MVRMFSIGEFVAQNKVKAAFRARRQVGSTLTLDHMSYVGKTDDGRRRYTAFVRLKAGPR